MTRFEKLEGYPDEIRGRFNSFITTQFDDSLSVEMQIRSLIKWINSSRDLINDIVDYINLFIEMFDERLQQEIVSKLNMWLDDGTLTHVINKEVFDMKVDYEDFELLETELRDLLETKTTEINQMITQQTEQVNQQLEDQEEFVNLEIGKQQQVTDRLDSQFTEKFQSPNMFITQTNQSKPNKNGFSKSSPKIVYKKADGKFAVVQKLNNNYILYDLHDGVVANGLSDTGGNGELLRLVKAQYATNAYVAFDGHTSHTGTLETFTSYTRAMNEMEAKTLHMTGLNIDNDNVLSAKTNDTGLGVFTISATDSESSVTYNVPTSKSGKMNVLVGGSSRSSDQAEILVNNVLVKTFNPKQFAIGSGQYFGVVEFEVPKTSEFNINVTLVNKNTSGKKLYFSCLNFYELKDYKGQSINMFKVFPLTDYPFISRGGSNDYAIFDNETQRFLGSYHGGETLTYGRMTWFTTPNKFDSETRSGIRDFSTDAIPIGEFIVTNSFEVIQQTELTTQTGKTAQMTSRFNFDTDGTFDMDFSFINNNIPVETFFTSLVGLDTLFNAIEHPEVKVFPDSNTDEEIKISEGYVRQRDSGGGMVVDSRFTLFDDYYNQDEKRCYILNSVTYKKLYYAPIKDHTQGVVIPQLTFSKSLDFYKR